MPKNSKHVLNCLQDMRLIALKSYVYINNDLKVSQRIKTFLPIIYQTIVILNEP